jgi:hypothetical protein
MLELLIKNKFSYQSPIGLFETESSQPFPRPQENLPTRGGKPIAVRFLTAPGISLANLCYFYTTNKWFVVLFFSNMASFVSVPQFHLVTYVIKYDVTWTDKEYRDNKWNGKTRVLSRENCWRQLFIIQGFISCERSCYLSLLYKLE